MRSAVARCLQSLQARCFALVLGVRQHDGAMVSFIRLWLDLKDIPGDVAIVALNRASRVRRQALRSGSRVFPAAIQLLESPQCDINPPVRCFMVLVRLLFPVQSYGQPGGVRDAETRHGRTGN